jgi:hypothetical protein
MLEVTAILLVSSMLEFLISGYLNTQNPLFSTYDEVIASIMGFICLALTLVVLPTLFTWILVQPVPRLEDKNFEQKYSTYYNGIDYRYKIKAAFNLIFIVRRALFVSVAFFMPAMVLQI